MIEYHVNVTETAFDDLSSIALYIKDTLKEPVVSEGQIARIKKGIFSLNTSPLRHPLVRDKMLAEQGYRSMFVDNYTIFYIVNEDSNIVDISRVQYSRRNWADLLCGDSVLL